MLNVSAHDAAATRMLAVLLLLIVGTSSILIIDCPERTYQRNFPEPTCENRTPEPVPGQERCICLPGLVRHNGKCIDPKDCPPTPTTTGGVPGTPGPCSCSQVITTCPTPHGAGFCPSRCASMGMGTGECRPWPAQLSKEACICVGPFVLGTHCGDTHPECLATTTPSAVTTPIPPEPTSGPGPITVTFPAESSSPSASTEAAAATTTIKVPEETTTAKPEARCAPIIRQDVCGGIITGSEHCTHACQAVGLHVGVCITIEPLISLGASTCVCLS